MIGLVAGVLLLRKRIYPQNYIYVRGSEAIMMLISSAI